MTVAAREFAAPEPDAEIIGQSVREPECFATVFDRYYATIHGYVARRLGPSLADDLASETLLTAFARRDRYDLARADARPWLFGIASNLVARHHRAEQRRYRAMARTGVDEVSAGHADEVVVRVDATARQSALAAALSGIPAKDRDVHGWGEPDPPSPTARATARAALMREVTARAETVAPRRHRRHSRRLGWLVTGTVVTAAAAVLAVVLSPAQPTPSRQQAASPDELSGQQILLQAAEVAQAQPERTGAYWHTAQQLPPPDSPDQPFYEWYGRDGAHYTMSGGNTRVYKVNTGFRVGTADLTLTRLEGLPTDPDKLKKWMTDSYLDRLTPAEVATVLGGGLSRLLWEVPAPPAVRAAALRALATLPNVANLGAVDGGQALRISFDPPPADKFPGGKLPPGAGEMTVVINPSTATLVSYTTYGGTTKVLAAGWTDDLPEIIPPR